MILRTFLVPVLLFCFFIPPVAWAVYDSKPLTRQADLGASLQSPAPDAAGALVREITAGGAAERSGLQVGDRILKINGRILGDGITFHRVYGSLRSGEIVDLQILRDGKTFDVKIKLPPLPMESFSGIRTEYGSVLTDRGYRVQTILTVPENTRGKIPGIFLVRWMSCDPVETPVGKLIGIDLFLRGLITKSKFAVMRVEKPGLGDSEGPPCIDADFHAELAAHRAALKAFRELDVVDENRVFIFAQSNGAGYAPLVVGEDRVAGYAVTGGWVKTWFEHMMEIERRRYALMGMSPAQITHRMKLVAELYTDYLIRKKTPGEILREKPYLSEVWTWQEEHQYGLPVAYMQQLQDLNLAEVWSKVRVPVFVFFGEFDWAMSRDDHERIAEIVNQNQPGLARFELIPRMHHSMFFFDSMEQGFKDFGSGTFDESVVDLVLDWMRGIQNAPE